MELPVLPPLAPMLGRLTRELPEGGYVYEPKWDGFRCLAFRAGSEVDLRSRNDRPLARYFPELVEALLALAEQRFVLDGEIVVDSAGGLDFPALMARLHPAASRVALLRSRTPAKMIAFDLLALGPRDIRELGFGERRRMLEQFLADAPASLRLTPSTRDVALAHDWLEHFQGSGIDGVMAKRIDQPYESGARTMLKVKLERTAECVVAGFRVYADRPVLSSLLLGLYDRHGELQHVGVASQFSGARRRELLAQVASRVTTLAGHPWERGFLTGGSPIGRLKGAAGRWLPEMEQDWIPLEPVLVCEVAYDHVDADRFRHPARFHRWRPDRDARSCRLEQLEVQPPTTSLVH